MTTPDSAPKQSSLVLTVVLGIFAVLFLFCGSGLYFVGSKARELSGLSRVEPYPGFGKPKLVKEFDDYWGLYEFKDLGIRLATYGEPLPGYLPSDEMRPYMVRGWAYYYIDAKTIRCRIWSYQYASAYTQSSDEILYRWGERQYHQTPKMRTKTVNGKKLPFGVLALSKYDTPLHVEALVLSSGLRETVIECSYYEMKGKKKQQEADLKRLVSSISIDTLR